MSDPVRVSRLAERVRSVLGSNGTPQAPGATVSNSDKPPAASAVTPGAAPRHVPSAGAHRTPAGVDALERALGGSWTEESGTRCFVVERRVPPDERCGAVRVGDIAERLGAASAPVRLLAGGEAVDSPYLFFDLETTGLSGGAGTYAFLVGCAAFDGDGAFVFRQFVVSHPGQERAMLLRLSGELQRAGALVSFNGRSFDAPLLETRYAFHRLTWPGDKKPHLDVLHPARRFWSARHTGRAGGGFGHGAPEEAAAYAAGGGGSAERSCSLVTLEAHVLGIARTDDVPGAEVPMRYFDFMRSGDARLLAPVLEHNRRDLLSLAALMARLLHLLDDGPTAARTARETLALGRIYERTDAERARGAYVRASEMTRQSDARRPSSGGREVRAEAQRSLALMARRRRQYGEAASWWKGVLIDAPRGSVLAREASAALAVHAEHREGDLEAAKHFALESRAAGSPRWDRAVGKRLARLDRKLAGNAAE